MRNAPLHQRVVLVLTLLASPVPVVAAGTIDVAVSSPQDGVTVSGGGVITWSISASVSGGDNAGLALVLTDLVQDPGNPELFDLTPADGVPPAMTGFSRPDGISNPGEGGSTTGYVGVLRGPAGARDLIQIGGAQNTFGVPGVGLGTQVVVTAGIGQMGAVTVATGSFEIPSTPGVYTFAIANPKGNTLTSVEAPPAHSPVEGATIVIASGSFTVEVGSATPPFLRGDCNDDGIFGLSDPVALLDHLFVPGGGTPGCDDACDANDDEGLGLADALAMLGSLFLGEGPLPPPVGVCGDDPTPGALECMEVTACP